MIADEFSQCCQGIRAEWSMPANMGPLKDCLNDIQKFMSSNKLKLNPDKTEVILIGSKMIVNNSLAFQLIFLEIRWHPPQMSRILGLCLTPIWLSLIMCTMSQSQLESTQETDRICHILDITTSVSSGNCSN